MTYYYKHNFRNPDHIKILLGIQDDKDLEKYSKMPFELSVSNYPHLEEKPIYSDSLETFNKFGLVDFGKSLREQLNREIKPSKKQIKKWSGMQKEYIYNFAQEKKYDNAIEEIEKLLGLMPNGNLDYYYFLRNLYVKSLVSSDKNKEYKLNKTIKLEKLLSKIEHNLTGINKKNESELILNILEDCKEADEELFFKMIKFVDDYYNRDKFTI